MSNKEILTLQVGEAGINLGDTVWRQYNLEHGIDAQGTMYTKPDDQIFLNFYSETQSGSYQPRTLLVDTDPDTINAIKQSAHSSFYDHDLHLLSGTQDSANNFARGHYTVGKQLIGQISDTLRKLIEGCDHIDGFMVNHSVGGGTGSGLTALVLERLLIDYPDVARYSMAIYPFFDNPIRSNCVVEPYNALLSTHCLIGHSDLCIVFDNRKVYELCQKKLDITLPIRHDMNLLMAKAESSMTSLFRINYTGIKRYYSGVHSFYETLRIGWMSDRLRFVIPAVAPLHNDEYIRFPKAGNKGKILIDGFVRLCMHDYKLPTNYLMHAIQGSNNEYESPLYKDLMNVIYRTFGSEEATFYDAFMEAAQEENWMVKVPGYGETFVQVIVNSHGCVDDKEIWDETLRPAYSVLDVQGWTGGNFHYSMDHRSLKMLPDDKMKATPTSAVMFANNLGLRKYFHMIAKKSEYMYSQRAYVHWYVYEGMEEAEFSVAMEDVQRLEKNYRAVCYDTTDEEDTDEADEEDD